MTALLLPLAQIPAVITESALTVLRAHGYDVLGQDGKPLPVTALASLFLELGRNAAQALISIDISEDLDPAIEPDLAVLLGCRGDQ